MSTHANDTRLQNLFRQLDGGGTPHEIANAVGMINNHLAASGLRLRDLTLVEPNAPAPAQAHADRLARAAKELRKVEIQRDVLATFVSDRVAEIAAKSGANIFDREEAGEDIRAKFGWPTWGSKARPRKRWIEWFHYS